MGTVRDLGKGRWTPSPAVSIAVLAHDAKKEDLARFMRAHRGLLPGFRFLAPEDTARAIGDVVPIIEVLAPDTLGGDLQVAAAVVEGRVDAVIFLHDPLAALPCEPSIATMLKVCDLEPIPLATNLATAEIVIHRMAAVSTGHAAAPKAEPDETLERVLVLAAPRSGEDDPPAHR